MLIKNAPSILSFDRASTRHGQQQSELKGQNQLLVEANEELQKNNLETQVSLLKG